MLRKISYFFLILTLSIFFANVYAEDDVEYIPYTRCPKSPEGLSSICGRIVTSNVTYVNEVQKSNLGVGSAGIYIAENLPYNPETGRSLNTGKINGKIPGLYTGVVTSPNTDDGYNGGFFYIPVRKYGPMNSEVYLVVHCGGKFIYMLVPTYTDIPNLYLPVNCSANIGGEYELMDKEALGKALDLSKARGALGCEQNSTSQSFGLAEEDAFRLKFPLPLEMEGFDYRFVDKDNAIIDPLGVGGAIRQEDCLIKYKGNESLCYGPSALISTAPNGRQQSIEAELLEANIRYYPAENIQPFRPIINRGNASFAYDPSVMSSFMYTGDLGGAGIPIRSYGEKRNDPALPYCNFFYDCNSSVSVSKTSAANTQNCDGPVYGLATPTVGRLKYQAKMQGSEVALEQLRKMGYLREDEASAPPKDTPLCYCDDECWDKVPGKEDFTEKETITIEDIQPEWENCDMKKQDCVSTLNPSINYKLPKTFWRGKFVDAKNVGQVSAEVPFINDSAYGIARDTDKFNLVTTAASREKNAATDIIFTPGTLGTNSLTSLNQSANTPHPLASPTQGADIKRPDDNTEVITIKYIGTVSNACSLPFVNDVGAVNQDNETAKKVLKDRDFDPKDPKTHSKNEFAGVSAYVSSWAKKREELLSSRNNTSAKILKFMDAVSTSCATTTFSIKAILKGCDQTTTFLDVLSSVLLSNDSFGNLQLFGHRADNFDTIVPLDFYSVVFPLNQSNFHDVFTAKRNITSKDVFEKVHSTVEVDNARIRNLWGGSECAPWVTVSKCNTAVDVYLEGGYTVSSSCRLDSCEKEAAGSTHWECDCTQIIERGRGAFSCEMVSGADTNSAKSFCSLTEKLQAVTDQETKSYIVSSTEPVAKPVKESCGDCKMGKDGKCILSSKPWGNFSIQINMSTIAGLTSSANPACAGVATVTDATLGIQSYRKSGFTSTDSNKQNANILATSYSTSKQKIQYEPYGLAFASMTVSVLDDNYKSPFEMPLPEGMNNREAFKFNASPTSSPHVKLNTFEDVKFYCKDASGVIPTVSDEESAFDCKTLIPSKITMEEVRSQASDKVACELSGDTLTMGSTKVKMNPVMIDIINMAARLADIPAALIVATLFSEEGQNLSKYGAIWENGTEKELGLDSANRLPGCSDLTLAAQGPYQHFKFKLPTKASDPLTGGLQFLKVISPGREFMASRCNFLDSTVMAAGKLKSWYGDVSVRQNTTTGVDEITITAKTCANKNDANAETYALNALGAYVAGKYGIADSDLGTSDYTEWARVRLPYYYQLD